jgi:Subtilase family
VAGLPIVIRGINVFDDTKLVVDLRDQKLVQHELQHELGISSELSESSRDLDLALLALFELDLQISSLREREDLGLDEKQRHELSMVELVLAALRNRFRAKFDGWTPTMGKERRLDRIDGQPYTKGAVTRVPAETGGGASASPVTALHGFADGDPLPAGLPIPRGSDGGGPRVGILDTAIFPHRDLIGRYVGDMLDQDDPPAISSAGHATFIAGVILRRAKDAELVVRRGLEDEGFNGSTWDVATKMMRFQREGVAVLNMSFGTATADREPPLILRRAVERLRASVVLVAAAGNHGAVTGTTPGGLTATTPMWPAAFDDVVAVGAGTPEGARASFSPHVPLVDFLAPGEGVASTFLPGTVKLQKRDEQGKLVRSGETADCGRGYATWTGTSFSAAQVSGAIAARMTSKGGSALEALDELRSGAEPDIVPFNP